MKFKSNDIIKRADLRCIKYMLSYLVKNKQFINKEEISKIGFCAIDIETDSLDI